jgi:PleD family two-component response regulator
VSSVSLQRYIYAAKGRKGEKMHTILIANQDNTRDLEALLRGLGHHVYVSKSGEETLSYLRNNTPDFMFLDAYLSDLPGTSIAYRSKKIKRLKNVPTFLMIETYDPHKRAEAESMDIDGVILKPYTSNCIKQAITNPLSKKAAPVSNWLEPQDNFSIFN